MIKVIIDNNVWDYLKEKSIDIKKELPPEEFIIVSTKGVWIETSFTEDNKNVDKDLSFFIKNEKYKIIDEVTSAFAFSSKDTTGAGNDTTGGGFSGLDCKDQGGGFFSIEQSVFYEKNRNHNECKKKKTGLFKNEADVELAAYSFEYVVLTNDKNNKGPLKRASKRNNTGIVFLNESNSRSLASRVKEAWGNIKRQTPSDKPEAPPVHDAPKPEEP